MKKVFIVNPKSGKGKANMYGEKISELFPDAVIHVTEHVGHATEIVKNYIKDEINADELAFFAVGGDGTFNEVVNGVDNKNFPVCHIPAGSGNDFLRTFGTYTVDQMISSIDTMKKVEIDCAMLNGRKYANVASCGFDAKVVVNAIKFKRIPLIPASLSYYIAILYTLLSYKCTNVKIVVDGEVIEGKKLLIIAANGRYYGGGFLCAPEADQNDEKLDFYIVKKVSRFTILRLFPKLIKGQHTKLPIVQFIRTKKCTITSDKPFAINADGETMIENHADFEILPHGLTILLPN